MTASQFLQLPEPLDQLRWKRRDVAAPHLHLLGGDRPQGAVELDLGPFGVPDHARTALHQNRHPGRDIGDKSAR